VTLNDLKRRNSPYGVISPYSIALQADYVTVVDDRPIMAAKYGRPIFGHNCPTQESHGLFATAKLLVCFTYRVAQKIGPYLKVYNF